MRRGGGEAQGDGVLGIHAGPGDRRLSRRGLEQGEGSSRPAGERLLTCLVAD